MLSPWMIVSGLLGRYDKTPMALTLSPYGPVLQWFSSVPFTPRGSITAEAGHELPGRSLKGLPLPS